MTTPAPPAWADAWLRLLLPVRDRETVSGDLMEEYRDSVRPGTTQFAADTWYIRQVIRLGWQACAWGVVLAALYCARIIYDWFVPTAHFGPRSELTTLTMISTLLVIGASSTLRTRSIKSGIAHTASALVVSAVLSTTALALIYVIKRDAQLTGAIESSGGLQEALTMPILLVAPGTLIGAIGATIAALRIRGTRLTN